MSAGVLLAGVLAAEGVSFVLVGSAALQLRGAPVEVNDTDVVVEPVGANLVLLGTALEELSLDRLRVSSFALATRTIVSIPTSFGRLDCMLERGRKDWAGLCEQASWLDVAGVPVLVASLADAQALRAKYKAPAA